MKDSKRNEAVAFSRYVRMSPYKIRRVLDFIRGRSYFDSLLILKFISNRSCSLILKALNSAVANLSKEKNLVIDKKLIVVSEARVDEGTSLKRIRPRAQGRGFKIKKRMSHIII
jgi:large subunit ribosomal protein L22